MSPYNQPKASRGMTKFILLSAELLTTFTVSPSIGRRGGHSVYADIFSVDCLLSNIQFLHYLRATLQFSSPCFWEGFSIVLQLAFVISFLLSIILRYLCPSCGESSKIAFIDYKCPPHTKLGFYYQANIGSSIVLLANHVVLLLMLVNGFEALCNSKILFLEETLQVIAWLVTLIAVFNSRKSKSKKLSRILRVWWMFSFLQSAISLAFDTHYILKDHRPPKVRDYVEILNFFISCYLLGVSIRGITGIVFSDQGITDPLLNNTAEKHQGGQRESLYGKATFIQLITFSWLNPLFEIGIKKPLDQNEVPDLDTKDSATYLSHSFDDNLDHVRERDRTTNPSIFAVVSASASYVGPYLIDDLVKYPSEKDRSVQNGYILILAFLSAKMIEVVSQRQWIFGARQLGLRPRAALISHIYRKGLYLSSQSRQSHTSGEIINYMSVDVQRITDFIWYSNTMWMLPVQISLAIFILSKSLGLGAVAALAATVIVLVLNIPITRIQKKFQSKIMEAKDERMKATSDVLHHMKTLKLHAWDSQYLQKLEGLRNIEYDRLWKSLRLSAISSFISWGTPTFISCVTFGACISLGIPLTAGGVLSALATFQMLQDPIFNLPDLLSVIAQSKVSMDRVASYLQKDEIQTDAIMHVPKDESEFDVEIENGIFTWDPESKRPTLEQIHLKVKRGMKVAICGTVGSGKSSLLSSILGEIPKLSGSVKISGTKAYVPQTPWIMTGDIRGNILFGNHYESAKYDRTVRACAFSKDFELFSSGDLTEIGERGINMSGGQKQRIQIARAVYQDADIYLLDDPFSAVDAHTGTQLFEACLMGTLRYMTVVYVTHQVEFLPAADLILVLQEGEIVQAGKFEELLKQNIGFEVIVGAHNQALESVLTLENTSKAFQNPISEEEADTGAAINEELLNSKQDSTLNICPEITGKAG